MKAAAVTVNATATLVVAADNKTRTCYLHSGTGSVYVGGSDVASTTGIHLPNGTTMEIEVPQGEEVYAITSTGTQTMRVLTPNLD